MATKRKAMTKKTRFEVFKRDGFKCQYCGASAPDVSLVVDHIDPLAKGGAESILNYITACQPCNAGKSDRKLSDDSALKKQKAQLDELNERREQLEMMLEWKNGLAKLGETAANGFIDYWESKTKGYRFSESARLEAKKLVEAHGLQICMTAADFAAKSFECDEKGVFTRESVNTAWNKLPHAIRFLSRPEDEQKLYYVRGILRNRLRYVHPDVMKHLKALLKRGMLVDDLIYAAKNCSNYTDFERTFEA